MKFNKEKVQLNCTEVKYLGHIVSAEGLKPDPEKLKTIASMPNLTDRHGVQQLLGSVNFLRGFILNVAEVTEPLRSLLKADSEWHWGTIRDETMTKVKRLLIKSPVLQYFDTDKFTALQIDSSQAGLGAILFQEGHLVAYASRALSEAEHNYLQRVAGHCVWV